MEMRSGSMLKAAFTNQVMMQRMRERKLSGGGGRGGGTPHNRKASFARTVAQAFRQAKEGGETAGADDDAMSLLGDGDSVAGDAEDDGFGDGLLVDLESPSERATWGGNPNTPSNLVGANFGAASPKTPKMPRIRTSSWAEDQTVPEDLQLGEPITLAPLSRAPSGLSVASIGGGEEQEGVGKGTSALANAGFEQDTERYDMIGHHRPPATRPSAGYCPTHAPPTYQHIKTPARRRTNHPPPILHVPIELTAGPTTAV